MDQIKWTTPNKSENKRQNIMTNSPRLYKTPVKQNEAKSKHTAYQSNAGCFTVLPSHITPPSGLTKFIARNPFESDLTNRLHLSVISPTVFSKVSNSSQHSPGFAWSVEELALIQPAKIEEFPLQQMHSIDPEAEVKAQAAIDQFFKENQIIPSPWETRKKESRLKTKIDMSVRTFNDVHSGTEALRPKKDGWCQTILSLPPQLPSHVEEALKPYFTFTQDQNVENDDPNSSNNSLRRKLFFNHEECNENDEDSSICLSPVKMNGSLVLSCSPPQSGMLIHGTPLKCSEKIQRNHGTPALMSENVSPPNMSPIHSTINNMSYESIRSRPRSAARLNFTTDTSLDHSILQNKESTNNDTADESLEKIGMQTTQKINDDPSHLHGDHSKDRSDTEKAEVILKISNCFQSETQSEKLILNNKHQNMIQKFNLLTDSCKIHTNESCMLQQTNPLFGSLDQPSVSNSAQDTGYQTYSMSNTTSVTDSCNGTPVKQKAFWGGRILPPEDEFRLSDWKENMKNIFSSTPSRSNRERDNHIF